jgi:hypothetical protein
MNDALSARFRAIQTLQRLRDRYPFGSRRFDEFDHAIDLALCPRRAIDDFFLRNLIRDGQRVLRRRRSKGRLVLESNTVPEVPSRPELDLPDPVTPENELEALQRAEQALGADLDEDRAERVLTHLVDGSSVREVASDMGVSSGYASILCRRIRGGFTNV